MNPLLFRPLTEFAKALVDRVWPDPAKQAEAQFRVAQLAQSGELAQLAAATDLAKAQIAVNQVEAASDSLFKSGWRPGVGWICGAALGWNYIGRPMVLTGAALAGHPLELPPAELDELLPVLLGLLGLSGLRTVEKVKGAQ